MLQVRSNSIISYNQFERFKKYENKNLFSKDRPHNTYTGLLKEATKKRLIKSIELMVMSVANQPKKWAINPATGKSFSFYMNFVTLTVYSTDRNVTSKEAYKTCLAPMLRWLKESQNVKLYIWKAELQQRGQIHYHLTIDSFVDMKKLQIKWNILQQKAGYLESFYVKYGHYNAPSTDIGKTRRIDKMSNYLVKEFTKAYQNVSSVVGKVWDCSLNIKSGNYYTTTLDERYHFILNKLIAEKKISVVYTDQCAIFKMNSIKPFSILNTTDIKEYKSSINDIVNDRVFSKTKVKIVEDVIPNHNKIVKFVPIPDLFSTS